MHPERKLAALPENHPFNLNQFIGVRKDNNGGCERTARDNGVALIEINDKCWRAVP
jgi:hypothetical protein